MSTTNNREDGRWFSLIDPKTGNKLPGLEGSRERDDEPEEGYIESEEDEEQMGNEEGELLANHDEDDEED